MTYICRINEEHLDGVAELEKMCFSEPWSKNSLVLLTTEQGVGFAVVDDNLVVAYGGMLCVCDEGQITNIAVHNEYRRRGFGRQLVDALINYASKEGISEIFLEVRRSNTAAIELYLSCGFEKIGERKGFYRNPFEDAVLMKVKV